MTTKSAEETARSLMLRHAMATHVGLLRDHNEDCVSALPEHAIFVVADGMGGHAAGRVASEICVRSVHEAFADADADADALDVEASGDRSAELSPESVQLARSLLLANDAIYAASNEELAHRGMGTTAVALRFFGNRVSLSHAGDSRAYLCRDGELVQVTTDHSLSNFLYELGRAHEARIAEANMSNVIMRALGLEAHVDIDTRELITQPGDLFLLCSDGLSDLVPLETMEEVATNASLSLRERVARLVDLALEEGGRDNISVVLVSVLDAASVDVDATTATGDELCAVPPAQEPPEQVSETSDTQPNAIVGMGAANETTPISGGEGSSSDAGEEAPDEPDTHAGATGDKGGVVGEDENLWDGSPSAGPGDTVPVSGRKPGDKKS